MLSCWLQGGGSDPKKGSRVEPAKELKGRDVEMGR